MKREEKKGKMNGTFLQVLLHDSLATVGLAPLAGLVKHLLYNPVKAVILEQVRGYLQLLRADVFPDRVLDNKGL